MLYKLLDCQFPVLEKSALLLSCGWKQLHIYGLYYTSRTIISGKIYKEAVVGTDCAQTQLFMGPVHYRLPALKYLDAPLEKKRLFAIKESPFRCFVTCFDILLCGSPCERNTKVACHGLTMTRQFHWLEKGSLTAKSHFFKAVSQYSTTYTTMRRRLSSANVTNFFFLLDLAGEVFH